MMCGVIMDPLQPPAWNGPICPTCRRPYLQIQTGSGVTVRVDPYVPKHRKPGPAQ